MSKNSDTRFVAFQYRDYRLFWGGQAVSTIGTQMQNIAVDWHIFSLLQGQVWSVDLFGTTIELGAGALGLGTLGLVRVIPVIIFALLGGLLADIVERRQLLIWTDTAAATLAVILAFMTLSGQATIPVIYTLTAAIAATTSLSLPARQALVPNLVPAKHLTNAVSLNTLMFQIGTISGPAIAGLLVANFDIGVVYAINAITFASSISVLLLMTHRSRATDAEEKLTWALMKEGLQFTYNTKILWGTILLDFFATLFSSARTMLPIVASEILGVGAAGYGFLATAQPVGALIAGLFMSLQRDIKNQGFILLSGVAIYGVATALFGISTSFALSYFLFGLTGAGDTLSTVIRGTLRQVVTPDRLRGRATSVSMIFFLGGPQLGELEAGLVGAIFGVPFAIVTGGIATVLLTGWVAWRFPQLRNYQGEASLAAD